MYEERKEIKSCEDCQSENIEIIKCLGNTMIGCKDCGKSYDSFDYDNPIDEWNGNK